MKKKILLFTTGAISVAALIRIRKKALARLQKRKGEMAEIVDLEEYKSKTGWTEEDLEDEMEGLEEELEEVLEEEDFEDIFDLPYPFEEETLTAEDASKILNEIRTCTKNKMYANKSCLVRLIDELSKKFETHYNYVLQAIFDYIVPFEKQEVIAMILHKANKTKTEYLALNEVTFKKAKRTCELLLEDKLIYHPESQTISKC